MAFKIDPDAAPLYKELKKLHASFKKVVKQKPLDQVNRVLTSVFASTTDRFWVTDDSYNRHDDFVWTSPIIARSIGAVFNAKISLHLDDDCNVMSASMEDKWIYGAMLPLYLVTELHEYWKDVLNYATQLLAQPACESPPLVYVWPEKILIENLGWLPDEYKQISTVSEVQAEVARHTMRALQLAPEQALMAWPNLGPWLNAMQTLSPPPEHAPFGAHPPLCTDYWQTWSTNVKKIYLTAFMEEKLALPPEFSAAELDAPSPPA